MFRIAILHLHACLLIVVHALLWHLYLTCREADLLVPFELPLAHVWSRLSILLFPRRIDKHEVAVGVVLVCVGIHDLRVFRHSLSAVVDIVHASELEMLALFAAVCVLQVIARTERAVELNARLREMLTLARDAVHVVVGHLQGARRALTIAPRV